MNKTIEQFARQQILDGLSQCSEKQRELFKLMHVPPFNPQKRKAADVVAKIKAMPIADAVASVPVDRLDCALTQIERTLRKNLDRQCVDILTGEATPIGPRTREAAEHMVKGMTDEEKRATMGLNKLCRDFFSGRSATFDPNHPVPGGGWALGHR